MEGHGTERVAVLGAGIVGICCAIALREAGFTVTLVDPAEPGGAHAASYGNGAWFSPASVVPMSMPALWRRVPGMLLDPLGPLTIRPAALPRLLPWLLRFLYAGATVRRVEATARALRPLLETAPARHAALAQAAGVPGLVQHRGLLYAYPTRTDFEAEALVVVSSPGVDPAIPVQPSDTRMGMTMTEAGLRGAGQVELASIAAGS